MRLLNHSDVLERAAWTFVQAFGASFLVLAPGIWAAPNLTEAKALAAAALVSALAAGLSALKNYAKQVRF